MKEYLVLLDGSVRCKDGVYRWNPMGGSDPVCVQHFTERGAMMVKRNLEKSCPDYNGRVVVKKLRDYWLERINGEKK